MSHETRPQERTLFTPGTVLDGTYEIVNVLGEGGMGQVFEANDLRLGRAVAIKASWPEIGAATLHNEARALASLRHNGLVAVHAMGEHDGIPYMVMERLYGLSLLSHMRQRDDDSATFSEGEAVEILIGVADALAMVHRGGFVHRDLKPANVMLAPGNRVVLMDFGVLQNRGEVVDDERVYGSPHYMAPEFIRGEVDPERAHQMDLYALGVLAFELLAGTVPFNDTDLNGVLRKHLNEPVPHISTWRAEVSPHLDRLVHEMMAKDPRKRPFAAEAVASWLRAIRRGQQELSEVAPLSVLIADDDPDIRALLETCVEHAVPGARIRTACDGHQALHMFHQEAPQVMLLDLQMPGMSGLDVCMHLRGTSLAQHTVIVAVSAHASEREVAMLRHLGVFDFVNKKNQSDHLMHELIELVQGIHATRSRILAA